MKTLPLLAFLLLLTSGCANIHELRYRGDAMALQYEGKEFTCELLSLSDSVMYFIPMEEDNPELLLAPGKIYAAPPYVFASGDVLGYGNHDWVYPVLGMQLLPVLMLAVEASFYNQDIESFFAWTAALSFIPALNVLILYLGTLETPRFEETLLPPKTSEFRKYARYPQGLTEEQLKLLLAVRSQTELLTLPAPPTRIYRIDTP
ncbi:MAG: hypothetical protein IH600_05345 [Bacteroidetes bacterium]|nr:hypothetical protein [Bacteroidota bacterium]